MAGKNTSAISGGLSGAATGAQLGSIVPGVGTGIGALVGGGLGLAAGFMGGQEDESDKYYKEMMDRLAGIQVPGVEDLTFTPEELQYVGDFSPEELQQYVLQKSEMENVAVDPRLKQEQMKALDRVSQLADQGFSDEDMMGFNIARQQAAGEAEAKQGQILQNMQARGQGGAGAELIARLQSSQDSSNQLSLEQQKQAIAQADARKQALTMLANQSSSMRDQDFGEQSELAKAKDLVNRLNTQNAQDVARTNVGNRNTAGEANLSNRQNLQNSNVVIRNKAQADKSQALKDVFDMQYSKATGQAKFGSLQADNSYTQAANTNAGIGQIGQGLVQAAPAIKNMFTTPTTLGWNDGEEEALDELTKQGIYI